LLAGCEAQKPPELAPGQVWSYDNRSREGASTVQILHVERGTPMGDIYFVSVRALNVQLSGRKMRFTEIWPLVFTQEALSKSVRSLQWTEKVERPYFKYLDLWWREAREGRGAERTFSVPVKEALDQIETERPEAEKRRFAEV
jgi:hypothetical protein